MSPWGSRVTLRAELLEKHRWSLAPWAAPWALASFLPPSPRCPSRATDPRPCRDEATTSKRGPHAHHTHRGMHCLENPGKP